MTPDEQTQLDINGIVTIVFGEEYDRIAAACMRHSRKFTGLPIRVLTNLTQDQRSDVWKEVSGVYFTYIDKPNNANRLVKILHVQDPFFDRTIYLDADALIQRTGIETVLGMLNYTDFVFNSVYHWKPTDKIPNIYAKALLATGAKLPLRTYSGGFFAWKKGPLAEELSKVWLDYWQRTGGGRDMPALACAVQRVQPAIFDTGLSPIFAAQHKDPSCLFQHNYNGTFFTDFALPWFQENKWFDSDPSDFRMTEFKRTVTIQSHNGIGDLLFVTPALRRIKEAYPDCEVIVNTNKPTLLMGNPYVDKVNAGTDGVFLGYTAPDSGRLPAEHHILEDWRIICKAYNLITEPPDLRPELYIPNLPPKRNLIGVQTVHKGNYHNKRVWLGLVELSRREGFEAIPEIVDGDKMIGLVRKLAEYQAVVCPEGGVSHIAAALHLPAVVVFGGFSDPQWTGYPDHVNITSDIECRHCYNNNPCVNKEPFKCVQSISVQSVEEVAKALIKKSV